MEGEKAILFNELKGRISKDDVKHLEDSFRNSGAIPKTKAKMKGKESQPLSFEMNQGANETCSNGNNKKTENSLDVKTALSKEVFR